MATIAELMQMGYDPRRMAQGTIGGIPPQKGQSTGLSDAELLQMGYDPRRVSQGAIGGLPQDSQQMPTQRGATGSWGEPVQRGASGSWGEPPGQQQLRDLGAPPPQMVQQRPIAQPQQPAQARLRDLSQIRNLPPGQTQPGAMRTLANPIDDAGVAVPRGSGIIRNNSTGASYDLNRASGEGANPTNNLFQDYSQPIEVAGRGKGYRLKGNSDKALINGQVVDLIENRNMNVEGGRLVYPERPPTISEVLAKQKIQGGELDNALKQQELKTKAAAPQKESPRELAAYKFGLQQIGRDEKDIEQAAAVEQAARRWRELNQNVETGRIMGMLPAIGNPERQEMTQIQNFLTMNNFRPGQGALSNTEREYMKGAGPSLMNDRQTNDNITQIMTGAAQNARDRAIFRQTWLEQNRTLSGADAAWQKYIDANPRFLPQKNGSLAENARRVPPEEFFGISAPQQPAAPPQQRPGGAHPLDAFRTR